MLAYHLVGAGTDSPVDVSEDRFRDDLAELRALGPIVALRDALSARPGSIVLTFDDAYRNFYDVVWPILRDEGLPATLFVPIDFVDGGPAPIRNTTLPACSWSQLAEMAQDGLEIGSHTRSHPDLRRVREERLLRDEIEGSRHTLEDRLGVPVRSFCYPRALVSRPAERWVRTSYELAVLGGGRSVTARTDPHRIRRTSVRRDHGGALPAIVRSRVWLEEALADTIRQWRP